MKKLLFLLLLLTSIAWSQIDTTNGYRYARVNELLVRIEQSQDTMYFYRMNGQLIGYTVLPDSIVFTTELSSVTTRFVSDSTNKADSLRNIYTRFITDSSNVQSQLDTLPFYSNTILDTVLVQTIMLYQAKTDETIIEIIGGTSSSTVDFNIEVRDTLNGVVVTDVMAAELIADTDGQSQTSFSSANVSNGQYVFLDISAVSGSLGAGGWFWYQIVRIKQ